MGQFFVIKSIVSNVGFHNNSLTGIDDKFPASFDRLLIPISPAFKEPVSVENFRAAKYGSLSGSGTGSVKFIFEHDDKLKAI